MILLEKSLAIKNALSNFINDRELIINVFLSCPELTSFIVEKTNEYNDENYSDYTSLRAVNGWSYLAYEGYDEDEIENCSEDEIKKREKRIEDDDVLGSLETLVEELTQLDYGEFEFKRSEFLKEPPESFYPNVLRQSDDVRLKYVKSFLTNTPIEDPDYFVSNPKYAVFHALDHGRFNEDLEIEIFSQENNMLYALEYARFVIRDRLPEKIEKFFILNNQNESDNKNLKKYLTFFETK